MALARIITRSHECSRVLAVDLLARGYAVEILTPDEVPNDFADLELRVEADPSGELSASVEAHNGSHTASLDFVHHLKTPIEPFVRRPPESVPTLFPVQSVDFNAEPTPTEEATPAAESPDPVPSASPTPQVAGDCVEGARPVVVSEPVLPQYSEPPEPHPSTLKLQEQSRRGLTVVIRWPRGGPKSIRAHRPVGWFLRAAACFAGVVVMALVLGLGIRRDTAAAPSPRVPAADPSASGSQKAPTSKPVTVPLRPPQISANSARTSTPSSTSASSPAPKANDLVAREHLSVGRGTAKAASKRAAHRPSKKHRVDDGVIAADTVTYLDSRKRR